MKIRLRAAVLVASLMQAGCMIPFGLQPPPEAYEQWKKTGESVHVQQVMVSLLECGFPWPWQRVEDLQSAWGSFWESSAVLADRCMESQGYVRDYGSKEQCEQSLAAQSKKYRTADQIKALEHACAPNSPVPKPSVEKRLNSPYCKVKEYRQHPQCQPVLVPSSQADGKTSQSVVVPKYPVTDRLTPQAQNNSNAQMNQLVLPKKP